MTQTNLFDITYPPIDELLKKVAKEESTQGKEDHEGEMSSKFALATYASNRARQIVNYYSKISSGIHSETFTDVQPLVDHYDNEKPLSIAMREIYSDCLNLIPGESAVEKNQEETDVNNSDNSSVDSTVEVENKTEDTPEIIEASSSENK